MPEPYDKSQGMLPSQRAYLAVGDAVDKELARAGISLPDERRANIIEGIMGAAHGGELNADANNFRALVELGQAIGDRALPEHFKKAGIDSLFGKPVIDIHANQRQGWGGYGWTQEKINKLGRMPEPRELSEDGRAAWEWKRRKDLLESLAGDSGVDSRTGEAERAMGSMNSRIGLPTNREAIRRSLLSKGIDSYEQQRGRTHGESGWLGSLQNPEYVAGHVVAGMNALPEALWRQYRAGADNKTAPKWHVDLASLPAYGTEQGNLALAGLAVGDLVANHLPDTLDHQDVQAAANMVEPLVVRGQSPEDSAKTLRAAADAVPLNYDEHYYKQHGTFPSYAGSSAATFFNGLLDPSIFATGPAAKAAALAGKGLRLAGVASRGSLIRPLLSAYGRSVYRDAATLAKYPILAAAAKETADEAPTNAGLMAAFGLGPRIGQPDDESMRTESPLPSDWMSPGVEARKDLWHRVERKMPDGTSVYSSYRPKTDEEIRAEIAKKEAAYAEGNARKNRELLNALPTATPSR